MNLTLRTSTLIAAMAVGLASGAQTAPTPAPTQVDAGGLISRAITRLYEAKSVVGRIRMVQSAQNVSLSIDTELQFDRPDRFLIRQRRGGANPREVTAVSDGKIFSYDRPESALGPAKFTEYVAQRGVTQTIGDMYAASGRTLLDRSPILDMAIARRPDLEQLRDRWGLKRITGKTMIRDISAYVIEGNYHDMPGEEATGTFSMAVTEDGDILQYRQLQRYRVPDKVSETIQVQTNWDVDLKVNVPTDPSRYR